MKRKNVIPIGQGCKPFRTKDLKHTKCDVGKCKEHFWVYLNICLGCGEKFHSIRPHAKTCSDKCRQRLSRRTRFDKVYQTVMSL